MLLRDRREGKPVYRRFVLVPGHGGVDARHFEVFVLWKTRMMFFY